ncbi:MAG: 23S rRNA (pseudouridine(1915)-N(3))-methyltransferase RlmH [Spirochaetaceae bacterium]|jgi:23S rRNA (pseudouridine1915-N3)-methyltransferase|nr:23S rRNA (pseudouridine(1915)-N(3))-methyltransferase RlmH [Spirochaetaceae bacterium]
MLKITLLCVGKIKEKAIKLLIEEYSKRLKGYCKLSIIELEDEKCPEKLSQGEMSQVQQREGQRIAAKIPKDSLVIPLVIQGKQLSSPELSRKMEQWMNQGQSHLCFLIGGSLGLSEELRSTGKFQLSFSTMTFPHQLMRVILLEQIYRAFRISRNEPYHK